MKKHVGLVMFVLLTGCESSKGAETGASTISSATPKANTSKCAPSYKLSDEELIEMQGAALDGKEVCPEWWSPKLLVKTTGVWLNGEEIEANWAKGKLVFMQPLKESAKKLYDKAKKVKPYERMVPSLVVTADDGLGADYGISALQGVSAGGYGHEATIRSGKLSVRLTWNFPLPDEPMDEVFIEPLTEGGYQIGLNANADVADGKTPVLHLARVADDAGLKSWIDDKCKKDDGTACTERVRIRALDGPFVDVLKVVQVVRTTQAFTTTKPEFKLGFDCPRTGDHEVHFKWEEGVRKPAPCELIDATPADEKNSAATE